MISPTKATVHINGNVYTELIALELSQQIHGHHFFKITIGSEFLGEGQHAYLEKSADFAGTDIALELENDSEGTLAFHGIITRVSSSSNQQSELGHMVVFEGYSPTILLESGINCAAFNDKNLSSIVNEVLDGTSVNMINPEISPVNSDVFPFTVQYNETHFDFINRLACRYGEWFYYDGDSMVFGEKSQPVTELYYGIDLLKFEMGMNLSPLVQGYMSKAYKEDATESKSLSDFSCSMSGNTVTAMDKSSQVYTGAPVSFIGQSDEESALASQIGQIAQLKYSGESSRKMTVSGISIDPAIYPGVNIKIKQNTSTGPVEYGSYIVISAQHSWTTGGKYQNQFTAVPADASASPMTEPLSIPMCSTQSAVVVDNNDPDSMGRVKVQFSWMSQGETPWIRQIIPYAGSDKGVYFVPEIGEEVMVTFEGNNAEKPTVIGSLYNGSNTPDSFADSNNDIKGIRTRSGHIIELNDKDGSETITIKDKEGNTIEMNTANKEITITAPEKLNLNAKEITITGDSKVDISTKQVTINGQSSVEINSDTKMNLNSKIFEVSATKSALKATTMDIAGDAMTNVKGGMLNLN